MIDGHDTTIEHSYKYAWISTPGRIREVNTLMTTAILAWVTGIY